MTICQIDVINVALKATTTRHCRDILAAKYFFNIYLKQKTIQTSKDRTVRTLLEHHLSREGLV